MFNFVGEKSERHSLKSVAVKSARKVKFASARRVVIDSKQYSAIPINNRTVKFFIKKPSSSNIDRNDDLRNLIEKKRKEKAASSDFQIRSYIPCRVPLLPKETVFPAAESENIVYIAEKLELKNNNNAQYKKSVNECKSSDSSDSSDSETKTTHPNRRLQTEKQLIIDMMKTNALTQLNKTESKQCQTSSEWLKAKEMWVDILKTPDLWKEEHCFYDKKSSEDTKDLYKNDCDNEIDYQTMLHNFEEEKNISKNNTLDGKRFMMNLLQPGFKHLTPEFYIPPAQVEVFYQELTDDLNAKECLKRVCAAMHWPKPLYVQVNHPECKGFIFSCKLKTKIFTPKKCTSNSHLSKELAASECLDWLGIKQRKADQSFCGLSYNTYFSY